MTAPLSNRPEKNICCRRQRNNRWRYSSPREWNGYRFVSMLAPSLSLFFFRGTFCLVRLQLEAGIVRGELW